jgi:arylformamidase
MPAMEAPMSLSGNISRRSVLSGVAATAVITPALAQSCHIGPPPHTKGPLVFMNYDQVELDAAYEQARYDPLLERTAARLASDSHAVRQRIGEPQRVAYGPSGIEKLDIYRTNRAKAPIFVFIHGGAWRSGSASNSSYAAEMFVKAGAHYITIDFVQARAAKGDLGIMAEQVRRSIAWVYRNAASFDGDPNRLYVGGHSSGGHLCGVALVTDWKKDFDVPADIIKGGLCMSGMYDMKPVRLSWRRSYISFTDAIEDAMSPQRHIDKLNAPVVVTYGTFETPEFQRQGRDFAAAVTAAGKPVELNKALNYAHDEMAGTLGNPYGSNGRAALTMMNLSF